ncbi:MAG: hypothetical protein IKR40_05895 [Treponema sp.]|nr:hypothetical protein [Treponema sp.]
MHSIFSLLDLIHKAFKTVADQFGFTKENCPGHNSFMPMEKLENFWNWGFKMYGLFEEDAGGMHFVNGGKMLYLKEADMLGSSSTGIFAAGKSSVKAPGQFPFPFTLSEYDALSLRWKILSALYESSSLVILPWG